jgi:hypothetical protein
MRKKEMQDFIKDCDFVLGHIKTGVKSKISYAFEKIFLWLPGSDLQQEFASLRRKHSHVLTTSAELTPEEAKEKQEALEAFALLLVKIKHEYCFKRLAIFHNQSQLHNVLERDHDEFDPYDRYLSEALLVKPWEHHTFNIKSSELTHENLIECSYINGLMLQGFFFPSIEHMEDLFSVYEDKHAPRELRLHAFVGATLHITLHKDFLDLFPEKKSALLTHYMDEGERHLYLFIKAYHQARHTEDMTDEVSRIVSTLTHGFKDTVQSDSEDAKEMMQRINEVTKYCIDPQYLAFMNFQNSPGYTNTWTFDIRRMNNYLLPFSFEHPSVQEHATPYTLNHQEVYKQFSNGAMICDIDQYINAVSPNAVVHTFIKKQPKGCPYTVNLDVQAINNITVGLFRFFKFYKAFPNRELQYMNPFHDNGNPVYLSKILRNTDYIKDLCKVFRNVLNCKETRPLLKTTMASWKQDEELHEIFLDVLDTSDPLVEVTCKNLLALNPKSLKGGVRLVKYHSENKSEDAREEARRKKEDEEIVEMLEKTYPEDMDVMDRASYFYYETKDYDRCLKTLFRGIYYHPEEEDYIYNLTEVFLLLGRKEDAEKYATKMMEMKEPSHQAFFRAGHIAYIMGHRDLAIEHYLKGGEYFYEAESFVKDLLPFPRDPEVLKECLDTGLFEDLKIVEPYGLTKQKIEEMEQIVFNELRKWNRSGVF